MNAMGLVRRKSMHGVQITCFHGIFGRVACTLGSINQHCQIMQTCLARIHKHDRRHMHQEKKTAKARTDEDMMGDKSDNTTAHIRVRRQDLSASLP